MNWLRKRREQIGIHSQEEFARLMQLEGANVARASVSHWELDRFKPPLNDPDFRKALAKVLKVSQPELLRIAGYEVTLGSHSEAAERAADIVDQLEPDKRELAVRLLEQFLA